MPARILTIDIYDSHTQADKIDRLLYKKILYQLQFTTAYYSYKGHDPWHTLYFLRPEIKGALVLRIFIGDSNAGKRQCSLYLLSEKSGFKFFPELEGS